MTRSDEDRIGDILAAAGLAQRIADEGEDAFYDDWKNLPVATQMIANIGAAAAHLSDATAARFPEIPWDDVRGMRNVIAHEYHNADPEIVWDTLRTSIPHLVRVLGGGPEQQSETPESE